MGDTRESSESLDGKFGTRISKAWHGETGRDPNLTGLARDTDDSS